MVNELYASIFIRKQKIQNYKMHAETLQGLIIHSVSLKISLTVTYLSCDLKIGYFACSNPNRANKFLWFTLSLTVPEIMANSNKCSKFYLS